MDHTSGSNVIEESKGTLLVEGRLTHDLALEVVHDAEEPAVFPDSFGRLWLWNGSRVFAKGSEA